MSKWEDWINNAKTEEEKRKWEEVKQMHENYNFDFVEGWYVNIYRHKCGHLEILQTPPLGRTEEEIYKEMVFDSAQKKCTRCIIQSSKSQ